MANAREILSRMKSVQDTRKITNAMYLISSTKLKKSKMREVLDKLAKIIKNNTLTVDACEYSFKQAEWSATISFLLEGGDGLTLGHNALSVTVFENEDIIDAVLEYVHGETAAGRPIQYEADGRVVVKDLKKKKRK